MNVVDHKPRFAIFVLLLLSLILGYFIAPDYGLSWDEPGIYRYSARALGAYEYIFRPQDFQPDNSIPILNLYGPAHFMYAEMISRALIPITNWGADAAHHFAYFITFLIGVLFLYLLALRWMREWSAFGVALLFISQPLFWGHALMNPKDTPFMSLFIASVYLGLRMMDDPTWKKILAAGIALGLATSIRSLGPMAGALVIFYGMRKTRGFLSPALKYFFIAALVAYLTWPYLWKAPIANFTDSLLSMSQFPDTGETLFMGNLYPADQLPLRYIPTFIGLQLTESALVLMALGFILRRSVKSSREPFLLFIFWFLFPTFLIMLSGSTLYDNARQLLFLLPPLFLLAGIGMDWVFARAKTFALKSALLILFAAPGLYASVQLHPYQYTYFNSFTGGTGGAFRKYDLDYWGTSFKESFEYLNENAPQNAQVIVIGSRQIADEYARPDLKIIGPSDLELRGVDFYYVLYLTRSNADVGHCAQAETVYSVERNGGILSYVKKVKREEKCW